MSEGSRPGERLERALAAFLAGRPSTKAEADQLLQQNPDLAELLGPMLTRDEAQPSTDGERVLGDFRLVHEIGRGGMGVVYEAWQRSLDRRVAVKLLSPGLVASPAAVARFRREASAAGRLRHPHIVEVFGFGSDGGEHFFAMQFVDGEALLTGASRFRDPALAVQLGAELADALAHAHAAGLVHRDVKPANVLVQPDGHVLLTDFGVARDVGLPSLTRDGGFVGTLDYASPEQVRGEPVDARTDVFALGVILHELLTGEAPFTGPTQEATIHRILTQEPPSLRGRPGVSDDLAAVVARALEKNLARRYASAPALLADLRALQRGEPVSARLPGSAERLWRWARREPWRAFAAALLLGGVPTLAGAVGYLWANAPRIEAATEAEARAAREELLSNALVYLVDDDARRGLEALAGIGAADAEATALRAMLHIRLLDTEAALAEMAGRDGEVFAMLRDFASRPQVERPELATVPADPFECFARAYVLFEGASHRGRRSRRAMLQALEMARLAVALAPSPRLNYLALLAETADLAEDRITLQAAARAIEVHFPDSRLGQLVRARCWARHAPATALQLLDALALRHPPAPRELVVRGLALETMGRLDEAITANRAAASDDRHYIAWHNLGACLRKRKDHEGAVAALQKALASNDRYAPAWNTLGLSLRDLGRTDEALAAFGKALDAAPDYGAAALNLGNLQLRVRNLPAAVEAFRRAVAIEPDNVRAVANLGDALGRLGRSEEALQYSLRAARLAPDELIPHFNTARLALDLGLRTLALQAAERAREVGKGDANGLQVYAEALLAQQPVDGPAALAAARAADTARGGRDVDTRLLIARGLAASGDRGGAIASLQQARDDTLFADDKAQAKLAKALAELQKP